MAEHAVGSFVTLVDQIIRLVTVKQRTRQQLFKEIIEPLFIDLQPVVDDYFILFWRARELTNSGSLKNRQKCAHEIRAAREKLLQERIKVREMAVVIGEKYHDRRITSFTNNVAAFFYGTEFLHVRGMSDGGRLVELLDYVEDDDAVFEHLNQYVNHTLNNLEVRWGAIVQSYGALRLYCLMPAESKWPKKNNKSEE